MSETKNGINDVVPAGGGKSGAVDQAAGTGSVRNHSLDYAAVVEETLSAQNNIVETVGSGVSSGINEKTSVASGVIKNSAAVGEKASATEERANSAFVGEKASASEGVMNSAAVGEGISAGVDEKSSEGASSGRDEEQKAEGSSGSAGRRRKKRSSDGNSGADQQDMQSEEMEDAEPKGRCWFVRFLLCCVSFLIVSGLILLVFRALKLEPFGTGAVSIDDAKIQYIDFFTYYVDVLHGVRPLSYDMGNMLGGSSLGLFSYYLASPFNLLLYYFGKEGVYRFFDIAVALKLGTAGATFCWFLQRRFKDRIRPVLLIALSMGYGLMQYSVAQSSNIMWLDGVYMLPLMLLGVYEVIHSKSIWRLVLSTAFCIVFNWYIGGLNCLFSGFWFLFEFFFCDRVEEKKEVVLEHNYPVRGGYVKQEASRFMVGITDFIVSTCRYFWAMGLGVAASAILFLPAVSAMRQGKGQYEEIKILMEFTGDLLSPLRGYHIGAVSEKGYAALFCGGIAVFAAAALIFSASIRIGQKIAFLLMMGICYLMLQWEPAMMAFSLFKRADSYWYRYSYLVCFALLFGAGAYFSRAAKDRWSKVFVILASVLYSGALLKLNGIHLADFRARGFGIISMNPAVFLTVAASLILSILTVILLSVKKNILVSVVAGLLLLFVTGTELCANAMVFWDKHSDNSQTLYMEYSEGLQAQLKRLKKLDGSNYRIAQDRTRWHYSEDDLTAYFNESLAQNYWSNTAYTSSPENSQLSLMWRLGYRDEAGCMMIVRDTVLGSDSFLGVKYFLESTPVSGLKRVKNVDSFNGRSVYLNPYALPMAFVYDGSKLPSRRYENTYVYQNALFSTLSGKKTEIYKQLRWTRRNEGDKAYFRIYVPEGKYVAYGNLLWPEKMDGLMSINGTEPVGYCRWQSPASFMIRSREEQAASEAGESLQAIAAREKEEMEAAAAENGLGITAAGSEENTGFLGRLKGFLTESPKAEDLKTDDSSDMSSETSSEVSSGVSSEITSEITSEVPSGADASAMTEAETDGASGAAIEEVDEVQVRKDELAAAASAFDRETLEEAQKDKDFGGDVRTVVFSTKKGLTFKDYQFYGLNLDALAEASERIRAGEVQDVVIENGHITCSVQGTQGRSLCLLVPWSKGWKALRNNEVIQPDTVAGTMITIPLVDGSNEIELTYEIPYLKEGMIISAAALAVMLIDSLCRWLSRRKKKKAALGK